MTPLEQRYRAVLKLLPRGYRQDWEDDMVATFLAGIPEFDDPEFAEIAQPSWPEVASIVILAARLRVEAVRSRLGAGSASPRAAAWGDAVRLVALTGLLIHAALATISVADILWLNNRIPGLTPPERLAAFGVRSGWHELWLQGFVWIPAYVAIVLGYRRTARGFAVIAVVPVAMNVVANAARLGEGAPSFAGRATSLATEILLYAAPVLALLAGFHRDAPPVRRPARWLAAYAAVFAGILGLVVTCVNLDAGTELLLDEPGIYTVLFVAAAVTHVVGRLRGSSSQAGSWVLALALLAPVLLITRASTLFWLRLMAADATRSELTAACLTQTAALLIITVPLVILAARTLRRLPPAHAAPVPPPA